MARKRATKAKKAAAGEVPFVGARRVGGRIVVTTLTQDGRRKTRTYAARTTRAKKSTTWMDKPESLDALVRAFAKAVKHAERASRAEHP